SPDSMPPIPVIDLFAGPGGLGEGFASYSDGPDRNPFRLAISIEMEEWAHSTLQFRSFMRALERPLTEDEWVLATESRDGPRVVMARFPALHRKVSAEAVRRTLG